MKNLLKLAGLAAALTLFLAPKAKADVDWRAYYSFRDKTIQYVVETPLKRTEKLKLDVVGFAGIASNSSLNTPVAGIGFGKHWTIDQGLTFGARLAVSTNVNGPTGLGAIVFFSAKF